MPQDRRLEHWYQTRQWTYDDTLRLAIQAEDCRPDEGMAGKGKLSRGQGLPPKGFLGV